MRCDVMWGDSRKNNDETTNPEPKGKDDLGDERQISWIVDLSEAESGAPRLRRGRYSDAFPHFSLSILQRIFDL